MTKRLKPTPLADEAAFTRTINAIVGLQARAAAIEAERDARIVAIQREYAEQLDPIAHVIEAKVALADAYATAHRTELLTGDKKSIELATAIVGWRTGNRTVKPIGKKWTPEATIAALKEAGLTVYVRTVEEIAKDRVLADCKDDKNLPVGNGVPIVIDLSLFGLKISQTETFYIEPKTETAETLKPAEAVA